MITEITLTNWKSYQQATLYVDPLTILIGTNSGGKSNLIEAIAFLQRAASGVHLGDFVNGRNGDKGIRGGTEMLPFRGGIDKTISLSVVVKPPQNDDRAEEYEYHYSIALKVSEKGHLKVVNEKLYATWTGNEDIALHPPLCILTTKTHQHLRGSLKASILNEDGGYDDQNVEDVRSVLSQISSSGIWLISEYGLTMVREALTNVLILSPEISKIRAYTRISEDILPNASNLAGVIAAYTEVNGTGIEKTLTKYLDRLSEKDIERVWTESVGHSRSDAMLYIAERWHDNQEFIIDARAASDGTLHLLAVMTALLTVSPGTLLIIEDIDEGLHSSRSDLLVEFLKEVSIKRGVDVVMTTHNASLLDAFGNEMLAFMSIVHRNDETGQSEITLVENVKHLGRLLAKGKIGRLSTLGLLENKTLKSA